MTFHIVVVQRRHIKVPPFPPPPPPPKKKKKRKARADFANLRPRRNLGTSEDHLRDKRRSSHATNLTKKLKLYHNVYLATPFGRKLSTIFVFFVLT